MSLSSMTGFARASGQSGACRWTWELRAVNGRGLDVRLRLPSGFEALDPVIRKRLQSAFGRGNITANLTVQRDQADQTLMINEAAFEQAMNAVDRLSRLYKVDPPRIDGLLALRGIVEYTEAEESEAERRQTEQAILDGLDAAITDLDTARREEGAAIGAVLRQRIDAIERLVADAEANPSRAPESIRKRIAEQIRAIMEAESTLDPQRLHQEAALIATKADIREELDRLTAHVAAARQLIGQSGPVGRKLDFLAQEFNRESNTLCSKSNDTALTATGLELKSVVDQLREQIQNIE